MNSFLALFFPRTKNVGVAVAPAFVTGSSVATAEETAITAGSALASRFPPFFFGEPPAVAMLAVDATALAYLVTEGPST